MTGPGEATSGHTIALGVRLQAPLGRQIEFDERHRRTEPEDISPRLQFHLQHHGTGDPIDRPEVPRDPGTG